MSRYQLAVCPSISPTSLLRAGYRSIGRPADVLDDAGAELRRRFGATAYVLTDSGTSALVLALRLMVGERGVVALPGYGCVDLAAAVRFAGVQVRLYDVDPGTLSPDLQSVQQVLRRGVDAVLVAHFYGYPADVSSVRRLAASYGVPVLEDAAQAAGGSIGGIPLGTLGDLAVLSFGRGKGLFAGCGGALMAFAPTWSDRVASLGTLRSRRGLRNLVAASVQWALGRPEIYALPASLPWLHLGEMIYRPAHEPAALAGSAAALLRSAIADEPRDRARRQRNAAMLGAFVTTSGRQLRPVQAPAAGESGFLRYAVLDESGNRAPAPRLGVMRGYPRTLHEQVELRPQLLAGEPATPGATELRRTLFTLPTHSRVTERDLRDLNEWISRTAFVAPARGGEANGARARSAVG